MKMNNRGFTLLEALAAITIMSIVTWGFSAMVSTNVKILNNSKVRMEASIAEGVELKKALDEYAASNPARIVLIDDMCKQIDGDYYGMKQDASTVKVYTGAGCANYLGTLNKTSNSTYFNAQTRSAWIVYVDASGLSLVVIRYNIFEEG